MRVRFGIHDPELFDHDPQLFDPLTTKVDPYTTKVELNVKENSTVAEIKDEIIPKLLGQLPQYKLAPKFLISIVKPSTSSINKSLAEKFRVVRAKFPRESKPFDLPYIIPPYYPVPSPEISVPYLSIPSFTYGKESYMTDVAETFVSLMRNARLDNSLSLRDQNVEEGSILGLSLDIDFALSNLQCESCKSHISLGHVYHPIGYPIGSKDIAGAFAALELGTFSPNYYTILDLVCPRCNSGTEVWSLPPIVVNVQKSIYFNLRMCQRRTRDERERTKKYLDTLEKRLVRRIRIQQSAMKELLVKLRAEKNTQKDD